MVLVVDLWEFVLLSSNIGVQLLEQLHRLLHADDICRLFRYSAN